MLVYSSLQQMNSHQDLNMKSSNLLFVPCELRAKFHIEDKNVRSDNSVYTPFRFAPRRMIRKRYAAIAHSVRS